MGSKNERNKILIREFMGNWQFNLPPLNDEILSSWLIRNAIANGSDPAYFATAIWDKWRVWTVDFDRQIPTDKLHELSLSSGVDQITLQSMTLFPTIDKILPEEHNKLTAWKWVIPTGSRNRTKVNGLHFCPLCLSSKPHYFTKSGRLAWNTICPVHKCQLINHCPKCHTTISPHLVTYEKPDIYLCTSCGFNLLNSLTIKADEDVIMLQNMLNFALDDNNTERYLLDIQKISDLFGVVRFFMVFFLSAYKNKSLSKLLGKEFDVELSYHTSNLMMEQRNYSDRHTLMLATSRILKLSKYELTHLLLSLNISQETFMRDNKNNIPILQEINRHLSSAKRKPYDASPLNNKVALRSKDEVDALFTKIETYLW